MPPAILAVLMAICLYVSPASAQTAPAPGAGANRAGLFTEDTPPADPWLSHSALKAVTYKAATTVANITILSAAAGGVVAGTALTLFGAAASFAIYAMNDYAWESHAPPPARQETGQAFDLGDEFHKTGKKFLTYKAETVWIKAVKLAALYLYTGAPVTTLAAVSGATLVNAGLFFTNNIAWDYYDWQATPPPAAVPVPPVPVPDVVRVAEAGPKP